MGISIIQSSSNVYKSVSFLCTLLSCLLILLGVMTPWATKDMYNPDLLVLAKYIETTNLSNTFVDSFFDNTSLIYIARSLFTETTPIVLVNLLQNLAVCFLGFCLLKFLRPIYALSIILFCFFTVFLNQFRFAIAIALCITGFKILEIKPRLGCLFLLGAFLFHFFVGSWFIMILCAGKFKTSTLRVKIVILIIGFLILIGLVALFQSLESLRFLQYLNAEDSVASHTYILSILCLLTLWKTIAGHIRIILLFAVMLASAISFLPSLSGRIGETVIISTIFFSNNSTRKPLLFRFSSLNIRPWRMYLVFSLGFIFFFYRFINWVFLNSVDIPDEIMPY